MKYYKLIDPNQESWSSIETGKIYPENCKTTLNTNVGYHATKGCFTEDWQEVPESEWLLQEAKERYPAGTMFVCINTKTNAVITTGIFKASRDNNGVYINEFNKMGDPIRTNDSHHLIYYGGKWAEIISKPKQEQEKKELKITKERVLSAAAKCQESEELLKELFPEVFEEEDKEVFTKEGIRELECFIRASKNIKTDASLKIPGHCSVDKAKSIAKLIYETWIKE